MRILVAPLELKGTLDATRAAEAIAAGLWAARAGLAIDLLPLADGGPGTLAAIERARKATLVHTTLVTGADGSEVTARWLMQRHEAVIESAEAVGITRFPGRAPMDYGSRGVGELVRAALDGGAQRICVGIGGTGTVDLGLGAAAALGVRFRDPAGGEIEPLPRNFARIHAIDTSALDPRLGSVELEVWHDVQAPMVGEAGLVYRYGGQKGVSISDMPVLETQIDRLVRILENDGVAVCFAGDGAGGGLAWGLRALCGARLRSGFDAVAEAVGLMDALQRCSMVFTAEGRLDAQSPQGKGTWALAQRARLSSRPAILVTGTSILSPEVWRAVFTDVVIMGPPVPENADDAFERLLTTVRAYSLHGPLELRAWS